MRHQSKGRKFGRKSGPRNALKRDVVNSLFRHGRIAQWIRAVDPPGEGELPGDSSS